MATGSGLGFTRADSDARCPGGGLVTPVLYDCCGGADRFVVVDTETTGVYPSDRIVEIALVTISLTGEILDVYDTLVQPGRDVSASHIHGITASMVVAAPTFEEIAGDVAVRLHGACLVAHNLPFDYRMLRNEFERLNAEFVVLSGVDTLAATGARLGAACEVFDIELLGAHSALADASATAKLFLRVAGRCRAGSPTVAPHTLHRSGRVCRRDDVEHGFLPDPPLVVYLASRLPHTGADVAMLEYLEVLGRAVSDLHLDLEERRILAEFAHESGLTDAHVAQAHRRYVNDLVDAAVEDGIVSDDEYDTLVRVASALGVAQATIEHRIQPLRSSDSSVTLRDGMTVVFTGDHPIYSRDELTDFAIRLGLVVQPGVNKATQLVAAADPASNSGKAGKARAYGIPIVAANDLVVARRGDTVVGHGAGQAGLKVVTCPDCLSTSTVSATSSQGTKKRCKECATVAARRAPGLASSQTTARTPVTPVTLEATSPGPWAPPTVQWLVCKSCGGSWHREALRGRKPVLCPTCVREAARS